MADVDDLREHRRRLQAVKGANEKLRFTMNQRSALQNQIPDEAKSVLTTKVFHPLPQLNMLMALRYNQVEQNAVSAGKQVTKEIKSELSQEKVINKKAVLPDLEHSQPTLSQESLINAKESAEGQEIIKEKRKRLGEETEEEKKVREALEAKHALEEKGKKEKAEKDKKDAEDAKAKKEKLEKYEADFKAGKIPLGDSESEGILQLLAKKRNGETLAASDTKAISEYMTKMTRLGTELHAKYSQHKQSLIDKKVTPENLASMEDQSLQRALADTAKTKLGTSFKLTEKQIDQIRLGAEITAPSNAYKRLDTDQRSLIDARVKAIVFERAVVALDGFDKMVKAK